LRRHSQSTEFKVQRINDHHHQHRYYHHIVIIITIIIVIISYSPLCLCRWGPTHTEIRHTSDGPRLIEINARWHAQNFIPLVRACLGYDAVHSALDAYFDQGE
jgi:hypothetical protein